MPRLRLVQLRWRGGAFSRTDEAEIPPRLAVLGARACSDADPALGYAVSQRLLRQLYARLERVRLQRLDVYRVEP